MKTRRKYNVLKSQTTKQLSIEQIKSTEGFKNLTDEEAAKLAYKLRELAEITYDINTNEKLR